MSDTSKASEFVFFFHFCGLLYVSYDLIMLIAVDTGFTKERTAIVWPNVYMAPVKIYLNKTFLVG